MLAVVEQRQCLTRSKMRHQVLLDRTTHGRGETKSPRNRHRHKRGIGERSEIDPDHAAGEVLGDCMSERLGQAGLSDDSGPVASGVPRPHRAGVFGPWSDQPLDRSVRCGRWEGIRTEAPRPTRPDEMPQPVTRRTWRIACLIL